MNSCAIELWTFVKGKDLTLNDEKKLATLDWKDYADSGDLVEKIVAAFGFPKEDKRR